MVYRYKKNTIVAYRIQLGGSPLYCHPECIDEYFPGEGEAITASDLTLEEDDNLYFPGEYPDEYTDRTIDTTCCGGCGQWFNADNRFAGVEAVVSKRHVHMTES